MKVINSKLAAIGLAAFAFASCSSSDSPEGGSGIIKNADLDQTTLAISQSDAAALASRVINYKNTTANARKNFGTRAAKDGFTGLTEMKAIPAMPENAQPGDSGDKLANGTFNIEAEGTKKIATVNSIENATIYVKSGRTLVYNETKGGNKIYVSKGGKVEYKGTGAAVAANDEVIVNEGTFNIDNDVTIDGTLYSTYYLGTKDQKQNVTVNGNVYLSGYKVTKDGQDVLDANGNPTYEFASVRANNLTVNGTLSTEDKVNVADKTTLNGDMKVKNYIITKNLDIKGQLISDYSLKVSNALNMAAGSTIKASYINVTDNKYSSDGTEEGNDNKPIAGNATATLNGNCQIVVPAKAVLNFNVLKTDNTENQITMNATDDNAVVVVKADKFIFAGTDNVKAFRTPGTNQCYLFQFSKAYNNGAEADANIVPTEDLDATASFLDYDDKRVNASIEAVGNHAWQLKSADIAGLKKLDLISQVQAPDGQSATGIVINNGKIYVSYHTRAENFGGNIEVAQMNGNDVQVLQSFKDQGGTLDFNHIMVNNNTIYATGSSSEAGAAVAYVGLNSDGTADASATLQLLAVNRNVKGYDANCSIIDNNRLITADTRGYDIWDLANNNAHSYIATAGKAKFVAVRNNQFYGLNYTAPVSAGDAAVDGEFQMSSASDFSDMTSFPVGQIAPNNGKNVLYVDGTDIYVCKSAKGLARYNATGTQTGSWVAPQAAETSNNKSVDHVKGYVNGVCADNNYVYVAAGAYGLVVLNKSDLSEVCHRSLNGNNSANYVTVDGNNIYVAYGQGRIQVFQIASTVK